MKLIVVLFLSVSLLAGISFSFFQGEKTEWIMPKELNEISGIAFTDDHTLACVQDEKGIIFLYDLNKSEITRRIPFAGKGDCEGIAIAGETAYVVTGDGVLYEVDKFLSEPDIHAYSLGLANEEESEAICYDKKSDRLLLAFKDKKKDEVNPGIFAFDLKTKTFTDTAVIQIDFRTNAIRKKDRFDFKKLWEPADLTIEPASGKIFMIDAINGHMLVLSPSGEVEKHILIEHKKIHHPEGIAISPTGDIYICNDANNEGKGKILKWKN